MRRPRSSHLEQRADDLAKTLHTFRQILPVWAEQARLEHNELTGDLPAAERGADFSGDPPPYYQDPTGETVVSFHAARDGNCQPARDVELLVLWLDQSNKLLGTTRRLLNQAPAVTLAVVKGRRPTDGRSQDEADQEKYVRALVGTRCQISQDHGEDEPPAGPGELRAGLCNRHRMAFARWCGKTGVTAARGDLLVRWQQETFGQVAGATRQEAAAVDEDVYKTRGVKKVA